MNRTRIVLALAVLAAPAATARAQAQDQPERPVETLSLKELLDVRIVSASKLSEGLAEAPATVIVISRDEILRRGYLELSEILDDLPGMDVVRPRGDTYFKNYWRGYRNTIGEPFLLLLDGMELNHLYFRTADVLVTLPLSNVERVEVVYGPASSVYGPDAFMGVINVITVADKPASGASQSLRLWAGSSSTRVADASLFYKAGDVRISLAARFDNGDLDRASGERYEYTRQQYYADRRLWGGFVDNPALGGQFSSPHRHRSFDLRARLGWLEAGVQYARLSSGYGVEYAADRAQTTGVWTRPDLNLFLRARGVVSETLTSTSLLRYRSSDVSNDSFFVEGGNAALDGRLSRVADFSYWQVSNSSWSLFQDVEFKPSGSLAFAAGFKYEQKDLQKAYDTPYGPSLPPEQIDASSYPYPAAIAVGPGAPNRITTEDHGVYLQGKWRANDQHQINLGIRNDNNSQYGSATTVRAGYVGQYGRFGVKALYGEAFQEPNPRLLYGGWTGSGSDPDLKPERSRTFELSGSFRQGNLSSLLSLYFVQNQDTIVNTAAGAENLGQREVAGFDWHVQTLIQVPGSRQLRVWGYYSRILRANEKRSGQPDLRIGDLADDKVHLGATAEVSERLSVTLRGRYIGAQATVDTNPVREVPSYLTVDAAILYTGLFHRGVGIQIRVTNLLDAHYAQPGVRDASAGTTPGFFDERGTWQGSGGFYSSLLPQPGRAALVSLVLDY